jgi:DNA-binding CsgD family transcriptional regulator
MAKPPNEKHLPVQTRSALRTRDLKMLELCGQGLTQQEIAEQVGLTRSGVSKALTRIERKMLAELKEKVETLKVQQHFALHHVHRESLRAWETSKNEAVTVKEVERGKDDVKIERTIRGQCGDPRHLDNALKALGDMRKLWGLDEDAKLRSQGGTTVNIQVDYAEDFFGVARVVDADAVEVNHDGSTPPTSIGALKEIDSGKSD